MAGEEQGRFGFDGAEGHAFWIYSDATHEEAQATIEFSDLDDLKIFLQENLPGLFAPPADDVREWRPEDGDTRCQQCGTRNPVWWADNKQWNATVGGPEATDDPGGVLCPTCYHALWLGHEVRPRGKVTDAEEAAMERAVTGVLSRLAKRDEWAEDDTAIGGMAAHIVSVALEAARAVQS